MGPVIDAYLKLVLDRSGLMSGVPATPIYT
jgi:hypothetical protein